MADKFTKKKRSAIMSAIRSKNTTPERAVRSFLKSNKYKFSTYAKTLPGKPDIVMRDRKTVIFIHGCFWHGHKSCKRLPVSNRAFWKSKIENNKKRDQRIVRKLRQLGWRVLVIWECKIRAKTYQKKLTNFFD